MKALTIFNFTWVVLSFVAYENAGNGLFWLAFLFPEVTTSVAFPILPLVVLVIAVCASFTYASQGVKGTDYWRRFFAGLTMCGAVAGMGSAGLCVGISLILFVIARFV